MAKDNRMTQPSITLSSENERDLVHTITDTVPVAITMLDGEGAIRFANRRAEEMLGLTRSELERSKYNAPGFSITSIDGGPFPDQDLPFIRVRSTLRPVHDIRHAIRRPDGKLVLLSIYATPLFDTSGTFNGIVCALVDITEQIEAERTIRHMHELLNMTGEIAKVGGWEYDVETGAGSWTDQVAMIHDMDPDEPIDVPRIMRFYVTESRVRMEQALREVIEHARSYDLEFELISARGVKKWVKSQAFPVVEGGKVVKVRGFLQDISQRKTADEERERLEKQLFQAQKIESIGILAAGVAHDFNNLLNIIMGNASLLAQSPVNLDKLPKRIDAINKATERGAQLVKQLLTFARKTDFEQRTVVLNDLILETTKLFEETFPKTIGIRLRLAPGIPDVAGDPNQLYQIIVNLCVNSRDAMAQGGTLTIATDTVPGEFVHAKFSTSSTRRYCMVTITDTGTGMDEKTKARIFDPFFTTKEKGKGTGLGLPVVLGIIESHRGFMEMESEPGTGTEFRIYLPGVEQVVESKEEIARQIESIDGGSETILFVEDEQLTREMIAEFLEEKGYTVLAADNGQDAVDLFERHVDAVRLILTDFGLPVFDGEEVVRRIKQIRSSVPVIMISGFVAPERKAVLLDLGVTEVLPKPYQLSSLFEKIRVILDATQRT